MKNIVLIGFMGTGKTSTGKMLAQRLGKAFIDLDHRIEEEYGESIPQMFATKGEAYFRECEKAVVKQVSARANAVIATGGGTVNNPENTAALKKYGVIVCLTAAPEAILERTGRQGQRPLLDAAGRDRSSRLKEIKKLLAEREEMYRQADFAVDTSDASPMQIAERIVKVLKTRGELHG
jgi:shikimate kinase